MKIIQITESRYEPVFVEKYKSEDGLIFLKQSACEFHDELYSAYLTLRKIEGWYKIESKIDYIILTNYIVSRNFNNGIGRCEFPSFNDYYVGWIKLEYNCCMDGVDYYDITSSNKYLDDLKMLGVIV